MAALLAVAPVLAACESVDDFDMDKLDIFGLNKKKPLPGERRDVFPGGVPGVTQGIPPEYLKSNVEKQQAAEAAAATEAQQAEAAKAAEEAQKKAAAAEEAAKPKPKPKPRAKLVRVPSRPPTQVTIQPTRAQPAQQAPWPDANQQQPQQQQQQQSAPPQQGQQQDPAWNAAPAPGTFSR
jgi:hypothetical protein